MESYVGLFGGIVAISFLPWIIKGLQEVVKANDLKAFTPFEPKYLGLFVLALVGTALSLILPESRAMVEGQPWWTAFFIGVGGKVISREALRPFGL
jgi:hypothetical protein